MVIERAIADEFHEVGEPAKAVGVVKEWEGVVAGEAGRAGGGAGGDVCLPEFFEFFIRENGAPRGVGWERRDG